MTTNYCNNSYSNDKKIKDIENFLKKWEQGKIPKKDFDNFMKSAPKSIVAIIELL